MPRLVKLELINNSPMFHIPGVVHLTFDNPGPVEIDADLLSPEQKLWVNNAYKAQKLRVTNPHPVAVKTQVLKEPVLAKTPEQIKKEAEAARLHLTSDAALTLRATLPAILKHVDKSSDLKKLRAMRDLEKEQKHRQKVLTALDKRIGEIELAVVTLTGPELKSTDLLITDRALKDLPEIEEIEEDTVTINLGA